MPAFIAFLLLIAMTVGAALADTHRMTDSQLVELVVDSLYTDHDDASLAEQLDRIKPTELLPPETVIELWSWGLGPLTTAALERVQLRSAGLSQPLQAPVAKQPVPSEAENREMLGHLVSYA